MIEINLPTLPPCSDPSSTVEPDLISMGSKKIIAIIAPIIPDTGVLDSYHFYFLMILTLKLSNPVLQQQVIISPTGTSVSLGVSCLGNHVLVAAPCNHLLLLSDDEEF